MKRMNVEVSLDIFWTSDYAIAINQLAKLEDSSKYVCSVYLLVTNIRRHVIVAFILATYFDITLKIYMTYKGVSLLRTIYVLLIQTVLWTYNNDKGIISNDINKTLSLDSFT